MRDRTRVEDSKPQLVDQILSASVLFCFFGSQVLLKDS